MTDILFSPVLMQKPKLKGVLMAVPTCLREAFPKEG